MANTRRILAVELLAACQALDSASPSDLAPLQAAYRGCGATSRVRSGPVLAPEIEAAGRLVTGATLADEAAAVCGTLE